MGYTHRTDSVCATAILARRKHLLATKRRDTVDYQIIATLGPASSTDSIWQAMLEAGVTAFRLNTSHLSLAQLKTWLDRLGVFLESAALPVTIVLDLQGSKWRLGQFSPFALDIGQQVTLIAAETTDRPNVLPVPHPDFFRAAAVSSGELTLNDAKVRLRLESATSSTMTATVLAGRQISARKGITYTRSSYRQESLSDRDQKIVSQTRHVEFVDYALSYVKDAQEMARYRAYFGPSARLIAKLERQPAVDEAAAIAATADAVWLCRGDLGAELGLKAMAESAARFSARIGALSAPALLAGQVLEHMTAQPTPTRAEICQLHDALTQGYRGIVLSDETAIGEYPLEACQTAALFRA
jgi:pyruvate kinase